MAAFPSIVPTPDRVRDQVPSTRQPAMPDLSVIEVDDDTGEVTFKGEDEPKKKSSGKFDENLADGVIDEGRLSTICEQLFRGIDSDKRSREQMITTYAKGMDLLAIKIEGDTAGFSQGGRKNVSQVRSPTLQWACVRYQAGTSNELLPAAGPVKAQLNTDETTDYQQRANDFTRDFNYFLTVTATEYYPDTRRGLFYLGYGGTIFKKVFQCPVRERPVSECVYLPDLIVSNNATDLDNAIRITHRFDMDQETMKDLQDSGFYRKVSLVQPTDSQPDLAKQKEGQLSGVKPDAEQPEDKQHDLLECYTGLRLEEDHLTEGKRAPYRITMDTDSRKILEIRRDWKEKDKKKRKRKHFVKFGLVPGTSFYDYGFLHLIGNHTKALTALWRIAIDAGMYSNFPGGLRLKGSRMSTNNYRPGPGEFPEIDGSSGIDDIRKLIMTMPYKDVSEVYLKIIQELEKQAQSIVGTLEMEFGEGRTNIPVGTILSMIEQQAQVMSSVHKYNHKSQQEELLLIKELISEDPSCLEYEKQSREWTKELFADIRIVPASDPNIPAAVHRIMQAQVLFVMAQQAPQAFNIPAVALRILRILQIANPEELINTSPALQGPPPKPDDTPIKTAKLQLEAQELQSKQQQQEREAASALVETQQREADRASEERIASMREQAATVRSTAEMAHSRAELESDNLHRHLDRQSEEQRHAADLRNEGFPKT